MKKPLIYLVVFSVLLLFTGCYKFNLHHIIKGKWYIGSFEIEGGSTNLMEAVLPDYVDGDGQYIVYCLDNGLLRGEYYAHDTLVYYRTGYWEMPDKDHVYYEVDKFIKGTFLIEPAGGNSFLLSSDDNYIEFFNLGSVRTVIRISRGEYIDPELTKP